jgi:hypothetical protein
MAIFLLVRAVSDRFVEAAKNDADLAFSLLDKGLRPPDWHVNAIRDHERRRDGLAKAGVSFDADAAEVQDLDRAWDGLQRTLETLGADDANIFRVGTEVGDDEEAGIRALTSTETVAALATLERIDRASVEDGVRKVLQASRSVGQQRRNPFTGEMVNVAGGELYGVGSGSGTSSETQKPEGSGWQCRSCPDDGPRGSRGQQLRQFEILQGGRVPEERSSPSSHPIVFATTAWSSFSTSCSRSLTWNVVMPFFGTVSAFSAVPMSAPVAS